MNTALSQMTNSRACQLGEEAHRRGLPLADAVQEFRRELGDSVSEQLVTNFSLGWIATSLAGRSVPACAEGAD